MDGYHHRQGAELEEKQPSRAVRQPASASTGVAAHGHVTTGLATGPLSSCVLLLRFRHLWCDGTHRTPCFMQIDEDGWVTAGINTRAVRQHLVVWVETTVPDVHGTACGSWRPSSAHELCSTRSAHGALAASAG